jgi:hypothetical protein
VKRKKPGIIWVVLAYLVPIAVIIVIGAVSCVVFFSKPTVGDPCALPGQYTTRPQDGQRLKCVKDSRNGRVYWLPADSKGDK